MTSPTSPKSPREPAIYVDLNLPEGMLDYIIQTLDNLQIPQQAQPTQIRRNNEWVNEDDVRKAEARAVPAQVWICGMIWHHIMRTNHHQWGYDIDSFDNDQIEYIQYRDGGHYKWHHDDLAPLTYPNVPAVYETQPHYTEYNRKISFSLMLNDDYEGGDLQLLWKPNSLIKIPKKKGHMVIFDSRCNHRVTPVKSGMRKVLVGWVVGPRWK